MDNLFIMQLFRDPVFFFMIALIVSFSICLHEYFHAFAAYCLGDSTAAEQGHLTLNPLKQMGWMSLLMFAVAGIAWGAVPVGPEVRNKRWKSMIVSFAGPLANLCLLAVSWVLFGLLLHFPGLQEEGGPESRIALFFFYFGVYNTVLFLLNLIPAPGFDGWWIFTSLFPVRRMLNSELQKGLFVFLIFLVFAVSGYLFKAGSYVMTLAPAVFGLFIPS